MVHAVISGGDRHACEPSACINLTNAASFAEFASKVRAGLSALMPQYREPMPLRMLGAIAGSTAARLKAETPTGLY